jgi:hypothetical protein
MSVPYKKSTLGLHLIDRAHDTLRFHGGPCFELPPDESEDEDDSDFRGRDGNVTLDSIPEIVERLVDAFESSEKKEVDVAMRQLRHLTKHYFKRILPPLIAANAFSILAQIFTTCPVPQLRRESLHTLYTFQRRCPDSQPAVASLGLTGNIIELIHETQNVFDLSIALPVLRLIAEALDFNGRQAVRENLPIEKLVALHFFVWPLESRVSDGRRRRVNAAIGCLSLLVMYCEMPMSEAEFGRVLEVIGFVVAQSALGAKRKLGPYFEQMVFSALQMIGVLTKSGLLTPACFSELALGAFVNQKLCNGQVKERALACEVWTHLLEHGYTGEGVEIDDVLDVIDQDQTLAGHRAMRLIVALLRLP